jgi:NADPH-dependent glutamate synthase beta subunit-like oxidoreductase
MDDLIKVYGAGWCPDRAKRFLGDQRIPFEWHDIEIDPDGVRTVQERNDGNDIMLQTSMPGVFAAGDVRVRLDQAAHIGVGEGRRGRDRHPQVPGST